MTTTDLRDLIERTLCEPAPIPMPETLRDRHRALLRDMCRDSIDQLVAALAPLIAREKAEALREAAAATRSEAPGEPCAGATFGSHADWLDERADQIEKGADQ